MFDVNRTFVIEWIEEDDRYIGLCDKYPNLSHLAVTELCALCGIMELVQELEASNDQRTV